jgi:Mg-chelatase subunit ChlD
MQCHAYSITSHPEWAAIHLKAPESENRTPIHLCCILDTSASMEDNQKLENVKRSLTYLLDYLGEKDHLSIITFSNQATTLLKYVACETNQKEHIRSTILRMHAEYSTNLSAALIQAREVLQRDSSGMKQGILLLTDGHTNIGITDPIRISELTMQLVEEFQGVSLSCIGYGTDHNAPLLEEMSTKGGGSYSIVENVEHVAAVFGNVLGGLISCAFQQVCIILPPQTEIKSRYATNQYLGRLKVIIGDVAAGMESVILAKLSHGTSIEVHGFNLQRLRPTLYEVLVDNTEDPVIQLDADAHYMRFEILELLDDVIKRKGGATKLLKRIQDRVEEIEAKRVAQPHALWELLLNELENYKKILSEPPSQRNHTLMSHHRNYLGLMKGSPSPAIQSTQQEDAYHMLSNKIQKSISANLSMNVSQAIDELDTTNDSMNVSFSQNL